MKTVKLLLVEDDPDNLTVMTMMLSEKYNVSSHSCTEEALTAVVAFKPDLLVLDVWMSPVNGMECLKSIRAISGYGTIPAVALTACARDVERKAFLAAGFQAVVTKPVLEPENLESVIDSVLESPFVSHYLDRPLDGNSRMAT
jgi:CheY-like chemotaxis protein